MIGRMAEKAVSMSETRSLAQVLTAPHASSVCRSMAMVTNREPLFSCIPLRVCVTKHVSRFEVTNSPYCRVQPCSSSSWDSMTFVPMSCSRTPKPFTMSMRFTRCCIHIGPEMKCRIWLCLAFARDASARRYFSSKIPNDGSHVQSNRVFI